MTGSADREARRRAFEQRIGRDARRKRRARHEDRNIWSWMGLFGLVGWSVAVPTILGTALGVWLDAIAPQRFSWTLTGLTLGALFGCLLAWRWVRRESGP